MTTSTCTIHPWSLLPCASCTPSRQVAKPSRETSLGTLPTLYAGEPTFATTGGALLAELVTARNEGITPDDLRPGDNNIRLWWSCPNPHHEPFQATVAARVRKGIGCPECTGVPRAEYIWRIVKALAAGELSDIAALALLAKYGIVDPKATISGPVVKGLLTAVRDEGLLDAIDTDPEAVLEAVRTANPPTIEKVREILTTLPPATEGTPEPEAEPLTTEEATAKVEAILDRAEAGADVLTEGGIVADLLGDDEDMIERLVREIEADLWEGAMTDPAAARARATEMVARGGRHAEAGGTFLRLLDNAEALAIPGFMHRHRDHETGDEVATDLTLAQRRAVVTLAERGHVLNMMTVGGGKTVAAIAAGMHLNAGRVVVVCPAPLVENGQWAKEISCAYGSHAVEIHTSLASRSRDERPDWWVVSVDTFSNAGNEADITAFAVEVGADYLIIDEAHTAKQRGTTREGTEATVSARSQRLRTFRAALAEANPALRVMGMTGTPTLNDLNEPISLLELTTGEHRNNLDADPTPGNVALVALEMRRHGIITRPADTRLVADPVRAEPTTVDEMLDAAAGFVPVDFTDHLGDLLDLVARGTRSGLHVENMVLGVKAEAFADHVVAALAEDRLLDPNAVVVAFSRHVDAVNMEAVVAVYRDALVARGLKVRTFTAADHIPEAALSASSLGCDVVIGTKPMGTGVNGLQGHARRIIILSAPWTWGEYEQVVGRLARTGQKHEVVVNPVVGWFDLPSGRRLSMEAIDLLRVIRKKRLADAVLYGSLPADTLPDAADVLTALVDWQVEVDSMLVALLDPSLLGIPVAWWDIYERLVSHMTAAHASGKLSAWHARWFHETSGARWDRPTRTRSVVNYGRTLEKAREGWSHDPAVLIADRLRHAARGRVIIDAGCSAVNPRVATTLGSMATVRSYDMASAHPLVLEADVTALPEADGAADYYVLSQAIMATNAEDYLREAHRVLHEDGYLYLAETASHFGADVKAGIKEFEAHLRSLGFVIVDIERVGTDPAFVIVKAIKVGPAAPVALPWQWAHVG